MSDLSIKQLSSEIKEAISSLKNKPEIASVGIVTKVGDGIVWVYGLTDCGYNEMLEITADNGSIVTAFAFNLAYDEIGAVLMGEDSLIKAGAEVRLSGKVLEVPVGNELVGRVVDPLGRPLDGRGPLNTKQTSRVE